MGAIPTPSANLSNRPRPRRRSRSRPRYLESGNNENRERGTTDDEQHKSSTSNERKNYEASTPIPKSALVPKSVQAELEIQVASGPKTSRIPPRACRLGAQGGVEWMMGAAAGAIPLVRWQVESFQVRIARR